MRIPDANVLLYALDASAPKHEPARRWLEEHLSGVEAVGFAWIVLLAVLRLTTSPTLYAHPLRSDEALDVVGEWLTQPAGTIVEPTERHLRILRGLLAETGTAGNLTSDAHLAALAIEYGATLASFDADFHRFGGLKLEYLG